MKRIFIIPLIFIFTGFVSGQTRVIAHRGFWDCGGSAQNSLVSLHKAHEAGCYGSEFDVIVTADGVPVIHHDDTIDSLVIEATNYDQIKDKKLKNGEILPTLEQYFIHGRACFPTKLILEIKPHSTKKKEIRAVGTVIRMMKRYKMQDQVEFISFSMNICKAILRLMPTAKVSYLDGNVSPQELKTLGLTGLDYDYKILEKKPEWVSQAKELGLTTNAWTVNDQKDMEILIGMGVDYITTNKPLLLKDVLEKK